MEHRLVMEQTLGRTLEKHERVHHKDGNRSNNDPANLELWKVKTKKDPPGVRASDYHCAGCRCGEQGLELTTDELAEIVQMVGAFGGPPHAALVEKLERAWHARVRAEQAQSTSLELN